MYRECLFEYNGINSNQYNLMLVYESSAFGSVSTGAEYEAVTDVLPKVSDHLLYGLKYADKPLSFEIEILSLDNEIPIDKINEVKEWLFGQDGYKRFVTIDERRNYYLNAILVPNEDIIDIQGLRGFRCTLQNAGGFWYKDEKITVDNSVTHSIKVNTAKEFPIFPIIEIKLSPFEKSELPNTIEIKMLNDNALISLSDSASQSETSYSIDTNYGVYTKAGKKYPIIYPTNLAPLLRLKKGVNNISVFVTDSDEKNVLSKIESITYRFTTLHRLGGF